MKRKQMIQEIAGVIRDTYLLSDMDMATAVLTKIESLGMKPPLEKTDSVLFTTQHTWAEDEENA